MSYLDSPNTYAKTGLVACSFYGEWFQKHKWWSGENATEKEEKPSEYINKWVTSMGNLNSILLGTSWDTVSNTPQNQLHRGWGCWRGWGIVHQLPHLTVWELPPRAFIPSHLRAALHLGAEENPQAEKIKIEALRREVLSLVEAVRCSCSWLWELTILFAGLVFQSFE